MRDYYKTNPKPHLVEVRGTTTERANIEAFKQYFCYFLFCGKYCASKKWRTPIWYHALKAPDYRDSALMLGKCNYPSCTLTN